MAFLKSGKATVKPQVQLTQATNTALPAGQEGPQQETEAADELGTVEVDDTKITQVGDQSLATQTALNEAANKQQRLNMEVGAELDRINAEFFTGQDIRKMQTQGTENRLGTKVAGEETRATLRTQGEENRAMEVEKGLQYRAGLETAGEQDRLLREKEGKEARLTQADLLAGQKDQIIQRGT